MNRRGLPLFLLLALTSIAWIAPAPSAVSGADSGKVEPGSGLTAEESFAKTVGKVSVQPVKSGGPLVLPYITWGGDTATFHANGGMRTKSGSIFAKQGLDLQLKAGDDFVQQVRDYMAGKTPFLRGTFRMMGLASEVIGSDPATKGVVMMQLTWSAGDHMVARDNVKALTDLKGKKIVLQSGGPHIGMLDDILHAAGMGWDDVTVQWVSDLTGPGGPAEAFRKDPSISACFVITPDMIGLSGGMDSKGSGAEGTVKDARVAASTAQLSRSIADVYVVRKDWYDKNKSTVRKIVAGYFKGCEEVVTMKRAFEATGSKPYMALLQMTQDIFGADVIPTLEEDAHGLIADCAFVGYPGNVKFFSGKGPTSFVGMEKSALDLAVDRGYAKVRTGFFPSGLDYASTDFTSYLARTEATETQRFDSEATADEIEAFNSGELDEATLLSFTINFEPNQTQFPESVYGAEFQRLLELSEKFGGAVVVIRGHADPTKALGDLVKAGINKGIIKRSGSRGSYRYFLNGRPLDLTQTEVLLNLIEKGTFDGAIPNPRMTAQAALNLSKSRANSLLNAVVAYAKKHGIEMDPSQIQPVGVGIREPLISKPRNKAEAAENMRVEFRLVRVSPEALSDSDFDF